VEQTLTKEQFMANELAARLPGQLDLIARVDIDRHERRGTGLVVSPQALRRAQGILTLLPETMYASTVNEGADGSLEFSWERHEPHIDVVLRMCALPHGGLRYHYSVRRGKNEDKAGGVLKSNQSDPEALGIVLSVVSLLTPSSLRAQPEHGKLR
jgi:hypothetical protein